MLSNTLSIPDFAFKTVAGVARAVGLWPARLCAALLSPSSMTDVQPFPPGFRTQDIDIGEATIHLRVGGEGPAVLMLHWPVCEAQSGKGPFPRRCLQA